MGAAERWSRAWWILVALVGLTGCPKEEAEEDGDTTPEPVICQIDLDCRIGEQCVDNACVPVNNPCSQDTECDEGQICEANGCRDGCRSDDDCRRAEFCEEGTQTCQPAPEGCEETGCPDGQVCNTRTDACEEAPAPDCEEDADCDEGQVCQEGACVPGEEPDPDCVVDTDCPRGRLCDEGACVEQACATALACEGIDRTCLPSGVCSALECADAADCVESGLGVMCMDGACFEGCDADADCAEGERCDAETGACTALPTPCESDAGCEEGLICEAGECVQGCVDDGQCEFGTICEAGRCIRGCRVDQQCEGGLICLEGACVEGCRGEADCEAGQFCDRGTCVDGCRGDFTCEPGQICQNNTCVEGCRDDRNCGEGELCAQNVCVPACANDGECGEAQICRNRQCLDGCRDDAACGAGRICVNDACQAGCRRDTDCTGEGEVCRNTACVVAEACPDDANEDNDYIEDATLLVGGQRVSAYICPSDQDVYALEVRSGCQVRVEVDFTHSAGDIDAVLLSEDETELRSSTSSNNDEELSYTFQTSGTYYVVVYGYDDPDANEYVENDYAITATFTNCPEPPPTCPGDDRLEPNDATEEASTITPGQLVEGIVCGAQEDYFTFNAPEGCNVSAELVYEQTDGDLALALLDGMGTTLTEVNGTTGEEAATLEEINGGAYFARVSGGEGSASFYLLQITVSGCVGQTGRLLLSEVFYDPDATDQGGEWVEIFNDSASEIDLSGYSLGAGGTSYAALKVQLTGTIAPGACRVIGGPTSNAATYNPRYDQVVDFWAIAQGGLQNGGSASDGVALFNMPASGVTGSTMPIDAVVYDSPNSNNLRDETGAVARPVAAPASGQSIERTREGWRTQATPNPNACTPLSSF